MGSKYMKTYNTSVLEMLIYYLKYTKLECKKNLLTAPVDVTMCVHE